MGGRVCCQIGAWLGGHVLKCQHFNFDFLWQSALASLFSVLFFFCQFPMRSVFYSRFVCFFVCLSVCRSVVTYAIGMTSRFGRFAMIYVAGSLSASAKVPAGGCRLLPTKGPPNQPVTQSVSQPPNHPPRTPDWQPLRFGT